ncbi:leucine-rich repeat-containing protein 59 [Ambystoma mexicanum]|uniref:leucine-rich repeat-containing protein 59 n=1 Tax=Ambystoma mexicanum TaxID=8296 RepID=UPI0037E910AF
MAKAAGKSVNLRDKLDGNELDLSLSDLNEVPVKELAALPKATILDMSCNNLTSLPSEFCALTRLVRLDLSKNQLLQLPSEFGRLINLQHLDLLNNRLSVLPVSFSQLKSLKWLDLKDNPLDPTLAKIAGDCLDEKQCKQCASAVLQYMRAIQSEQDRQRQLQLHAQREQEKKRDAEQRVRDAQERELRRREKAEEKERRRREYDALRAAQIEVDKKSENSKSQPRKTSASASLPSVRTRSWIGILLGFIFGGLLCTLGILTVCAVTDLKNQPLCTSVNSMYEEMVFRLQNHKILQSVLHHNSQQ